MAISNYKALSVDNKPVKVATLNGKLIYSALEDFGSNNMSIANSELSAAGVTITEEGGYAFPLSDLPITIQVSEEETVSLYNEDLTFVQVGGEYSIEVRSPYGILGTFNAEEPQSEGAYWSYTSGGREVETWYYGGNWTTPEDYVGPNFYRASGQEVTLSGTYVPPGDTSAYTYFCYNTEPVSFVDAGMGVNNWFAISPTTFVIAQHYGKPVGTFTYHGDTYRIKDSTELSAWAKENGFNIADTAIGDIRLVDTDEATALSNILPIMSNLQFQAIFQKDTISGLAGWVVPKLTEENFANKPQPVVVRGVDSNGELVWSSPQLLSSLVPAEYTSMTEYPTYLGTTGDSGRPVVVNVND